MPYYHYKEVNKHVPVHSNLHSSHNIKIKKRQRKKDNKDVFHMDVVFMFLCCICIMLSGIDLADMASDVLQPQGDDTARISWNIRKKIAAYQETFSVIERVSYCSYYCAWP